MTHVSKTTRATGRKEAETCNPTQSLLYCTQPSTSFQGESPGRTCLVSRNISTDPHILWNTVPCPYGEPYQSYPLAWNSLNCLYQRRTREGTLPCPGGTMVFRNSGSAEYLVLAYQYRYYMPHHCILPSIKSLFCAHHSLIMYRPYKENQYTCNIVATFLYYYHYFYYQATPTRPTRPTDSLGLNFFFSQATEL